METFEKTALRAYVDYVYDQDVQILANRREALRLFNSAIRQSEGLSSHEIFSFPAEKADKIATYLTSEETHRGDTITVYAFVRLMGELRRSLRAIGAPVPLQISPGTSSSPCGSAHTEAHSIVDAPQ